MFASLVAAHAVPRRLFQMLIIGLDFMHRCVRQPGVGFWVTAEQPRALVDRSGGRQSRPALASHQGSWLCCQARATDPCWAGGCLCPTGGAT